MEDAIRLNPNIFCRSCLAESPNMVPLTTSIFDNQRTLADVISFVADKSLKTDEKLPKNICSDCERMLCKAERFKRLWIESQDVLTKIFETCISELSADAHTVTKIETAANDEVSDPTSYSYDRKLVNCMKDKKPNITGSIKLIPVLEIKEKIKYELSDYLDDDMDVDGASSIDTTIVKKSELDKYDRCSNYANENYKLNSELLDNANSKHIPISNNTKVVTPLSCETCGSVFLSKKSFKEHKHTEKDAEYLEYYQCSECMRKFKKKSSLEYHMKHHQMKNSIIFTCSTCKREFKHQGHLENHLATHNKELTCEFCIATFSTQEECDEHKKSHKDDKKHRCSVCGKAFNMLSTLTDHMRTHTGEKPFLCSVCGRGFSQKTNLLQHTRRHLGLKQFKCHSCDRRFVSKGELVAHERTHSGAHPFLCGVCGNGFTTSSSLVKHQRIHTGERPYACDLCHMKFSASGTLKNHRRTHTGEKPYQCSYCEKAFVQRQDLVSHIRCHTGERPFACNVCGQSFRKSSGLKTHVKIHKDKPDAGIVSAGFNGS